MANDDDDVVVTIEVEIDKVVAEHTGMANDVGGAVIVMEIDIFFACPLEANESEIDIGEAASVSVTVYEQLEAGVCVI